MKKIMNIWLMAALVCGLSLSVTSCKDDDDDNTSEQRNADADPLDTPEAQTAWRWLCALTDAQTLEPNWASKIYEPTIGVVSSQNELNRIVVVNDIDEARMNFGSFADVSPEELVSAKTVSQKGVGSLTWTPAAAGADNLATVDVQSSLLPRLRQIIYCTTDQVGKNFGSFNDVCYYRFGDVIRDNDGYYWVCVRPSHAPNKNESHWINFFNYRSGQPIPAANIYSKYNKAERYGGNTILLPTGLKATREHIFNLSNLMWAMKNPAAYRDVAANNKAKGLGGFDYTWNGFNFITAVANYWEQTYEGTNGKTLYEEVFGCKRSEFQALKKLNIFYKGYSWWTGNSPQLWCFKSSAYLPLSQYSGKEKLDEVSFDVTNGGFDITMAAGNPDAVATPNLPKQFTDDNQGYFLVRYKTGDQLTENGSYSRYRTINGPNDVYRFNEKTGTAVQTKLVEDGNVSAATPLAEPVVGCILGKDGRFYNNVEVCQSNGTEPIAVVVYAGNKIVEKDTQFNGLAVALKDVNDDVRSSMPFQNDTRRFYCSSYSPSVVLAKEMYDGAAMTKKMADGTCHEGHEHRIVKYTAQFAEKNGYNLDKNTFSDFFVPSFGQLKLAIESIDEEYSFEETNTNGGLGKLFAKAGLITNLGFSYPEGLYATSTEYDWTSIYAIDFTNEYGQAKYTVESKFKTGGFKVRPFIAFKFGRGGTEAPLRVPVQHVDVPPAVGTVMTADGKFYQTKADANMNLKTPVGLVVCADLNGANVDDSFKQKGLVIGLYDVMAPWCNEVCEKDIDRNPNLIYSEAATDPTKLAAILNGVSLTKKLEEVTKDSKYDLPFYGGKPDFVALAGKKYYDEHYKLNFNTFATSGWFMPSIGQWLRVYRDNGVEITNSGKFADTELAVRSLNAIFMNAGLDDEMLLTDDNYLSVTQFDARSVWSLGEKYNLMPVDMYKKDVTYPTRFFVAFEVLK